MRVLPFVSPASGLPENARSPQRMVGKGRYRGHRRSRDLSRAWWTAVGWHLGLVAGEGFPEENVHGLARRRFVRLYGPITAVFGHDKGIMWELFVLCRHAFFG